MSRNKDIKFMHEVTGRSYKECRKKLKDNHWDLFKAMGYEEALKYISDALPRICEDIAGALKYMAEAAAKLANDTAEAIKKMTIGLSVTEPIRLSVDPVTKEINEE